MMMERNSMMDEARHVMARSIGEIRDAVRELRESAPDSALASLAEEMIERMEKGRREVRDHHREASNGTTARNGQADHAAG